MEKLREDGYPDDLTGLKFGKLEVMYKCDLPMWNTYHCKCECGNERDFRRSRLINGHNLTCGSCLYDLTVNGDSKSLIYDRYRNMLDRCYNPNCPEYKNYGGRGIKVCDRWKECYSNFKEDMYEEFKIHIKIHGKHDTTLDRIDVDGNYCKENCRWATQKEQARNKQDTIRINVGGITKSLVEWVEIMNLNYATILGRIHHGMNPEQAVMIPIKKINKLYYHDTPLKDYCRENDLSYKLITTRIYQGWDIDSAVEAPKGVRYKDWLNRESGVLPSIHKIIYYEGIPLKQYCRENNLDYSRIVSRLKLGWDIESAIYAPKGVRYKDWVARTNNNSVKVKSDLYYKGIKLKQYCEEHNISYSLVCHRTARGWDIDSAVEAPKGTQYKTWLKMKENNKNSLDNSE